MWFIFARGRGNGLFCSFSHPPADRSELFLLTDSLEVPFLQIPDSELWFFAHGGMGFMYAFMGLGWLPSFKVAALKIAGNGCGVQV